MKNRISLAAPAVLLSAIALHAHAAPSVGSFDGFSAGTINGQFGWSTQDAFLTSSTVGNWDQGIVNVNGKNVWRMSNAVTSSTYSSQPFTYRTQAVAGESGAALWNDRGTNGSAPTAPQAGGYATSNQFYSRVDFRSATGAAQAGLALTLSASAKQSAVRMSWLQIADNGTSGFNLRVYDVVGNGQFPTTYATIASNLSYSDLHRLETTIDFVDGVTTGSDGKIYSNDILKIYLNGTLIHTGSTWESYYRLNELITPGTPRLQAVDSLLIRSAGTAATNTMGNGFYFEHIEVGNVPAPGAMALLAVAGLTSRRRR